MNLSKATALVLFVTFGRAIAGTGIEKKGLRHRAAKADSTDGPEFVDVIVELNDNDNDDQGVGGLDGERTPPGLAKAAEKRSQAAAFARGKGLSPKFSYGATIYGFSAQKVSRGQLKQLESDPAVKSVELDGMIGLDPVIDDNEGGNNLFGGRQLRNGVDEERVLQGQSIPWGIERVGAVGHGIDVSGKRVCVFDTGVDLNNADLNVSSDCFNVLSGSEGQSCQDNNGHGTHVAGIVAAKDNKVGVVGVAPGATIVPIKVMGGDPPSGTWSGLIAGIEWAAENGNCDIANMSLSAPRNEAGNNAVIALGQRGVKVVLIAGNDSQDAAGYSPGSAKGVNLYTVSAMNGIDKLASFSNYGRLVDVVAPGYFIDSLAIGGGIVNLHGTSMAAPHVAGLLLLTGDICFDGTVEFLRDGVTQSLPIAHMCSGGPPPPPPTTAATTTRATTTTQATTTTGATVTTQATTTQVTTNPATTTTQATTTTRATTTRATTTPPTCGRRNARCSSNSDCCGGFRCHRNRKCR